MSVTMDDSIKRWTAKRKTALVVEIIQGKTTVAEASRAYDLSPSEIEGWVEDAKRGMENALRANPLEIREQYEKQLKDLQEAYGEAMLELRARKSWWPLWSGRTDNDPDAPEGPLGGWDRSAADEALRLVRRASADGLLQADQGRTAG
jgi:transposase-like protein